MALASAPARRACSMSWSAAGCQALPARIARTCADTVGLSLASLVQVGFERCFDLLPRLHPPGGQLLGVVVDDLTDPGVLCDQFGEHSGVDRSAE